MKRVNMSNVKEAGDFSRPTAGAYICKIVKVEDLPEKEYLKVTYDIANGEFSGYYDDLRDRFPASPWIGAYVKSYKTKALPMFKRFCSAVSKSNGSYVFDGDAINADEKTLVGKKIGLLFQEEEYYGNDGEKRTRLIVNKEFPTADIDRQRTPAPKRLKEEEEQEKNAALDGFLSIPESNDDEELPF